MNFSKPTLYPDLQTFWIKFIVQMVNEKKLTHLTKHTRVFFSCNGAAERMR